ncbi:hypothetical protein AWM70_15980 [Paenibacillus yonginensis]|uniref:Uncharacterized protein n=1 Tax=Paenibacillus yonginensis TaxID=1462996 RepID=A0A1B1N3A3_9BACL|nr:hypothetical protein [Paenibacillus yonginensis]ANS75900.1 hypothetical protein AWM70_15980 [Paenibacillus yonginensis]
MNKEKDRNFMINEILLIIAYAAVYIAGCRPIKGQKQVYKKAVLALLFVWSAVEWILGSNGKWYPTLSVVYFTFYKPIGQAIVHWLGG